MKLWLLRKISAFVAYDTAYGFVIRAQSETDARQLASQQAGDEGTDTWLSDRYSTCEELSAKGAAGVILRDFNAS